ncbi:hemolysin XhlA [compost metagenome]
MANDDYFPEILQRLTRIEENTKNLSEKVKELEDDRKWLWRTTFGGIIVAVMGFFYRGGA